MPCTPRLWWYLNFDIRKHNTNQHIRNELPRSLNSKNGLPYTDGLMLPCLFHCNNSSGLRCPEIPQMARHNVHYARTDDSSHVRCVLDLARIVRINECLALGLGRLYLYPRSSDICHTSTREVRSR